MTTTPDSRPGVPAAMLQASQTENDARLAMLLWYVLAGALFGIVLVRSEVASWYRLQEMFRFQSFRMFGILGSAMLTAFVSLQLLRRLGARSIGGEPISIPAKQLGRGYRYWIGGGLFGVGWVLTGACPGPLFALIGSEGPIFVVVAVAALAGTWTYGYLRPRLPH